VEIFQRGVRVASHARSFVPYVATTVPEHRPQSTLVSGGFLLDSLTPGLPDSLTP